MRVSKRTGKETPFDIHYASLGMNCRAIPEEEAIVAKDSKYAYLYARDVIKGRFKAGEPVIAQDPERAYYYARDIIKGRWRKGEPAILTCPKHSCLYARDVIKGRWKRAEATVLRGQPWHLESYVWFIANILKEG